MHYVADVDDSRPIDLAAELQMSFRTARLGQDAGAELGASPNFSIGLPSPELNPPQPSPSPDPFTALDLQPLDVNPTGTFTIENGTAEGGRYSMRTRQPRQLKPYAFDRLAYKQQLKHHPDAIVKLVGRRSPVESSSRSGEGDTDGAAENSGGEHPSVDARTLPRIKGKKRYRAGRGHPSTPPPVANRRMSGVQLSSGSPLDRRFTGSHAITDLALVESIPGIDGGDSPVEAGAWYPGAFNDSSSGLGGDDMPLSTAQDEIRDDHTLPSRAKQRRVLFLLFDLCI
jgi:hypothetical protein